MSPITQSDESAYRGLFHRSGQARPGRTWLTIETTADAPLSRGLHAVLVTVRHESDTSSSAPYLRGRLTFGWKVGKVVAELPRYTTTPRADDRPGARGRSDPA